MTIGALAAYALPGSVDYVRFMGREGTPVQKQKVTAAAKAAASYNNENRIKEESQIVDFFKQQGLQVTTPDLDAFRRTVQGAYLGSEYAKVWPTGMLERINATK